MISAVCYRKQILLESEVDDVSGWKCVVYVHQCSSLNTWKLREEYRDRRHQDQKPTVRRIRGTGAGGQLGFGAAANPHHSKRWQKRVSERERDRREVERGSDRWTQKRGVAVAWHILGLVDYFHLCLSCNRSVGMSCQWVICIQLPVGWTDHLRHRLALLHMAQWGLYQFTKKRQTRVSAVTERNFKCYFTLSFFGASQQRSTI